MLAAFAISLLLTFSAHAGTAFLTASRLMAPIEWTLDEPFHGAGIFFEADAERIYFITNAHVIPKDFGVKGTLRMRHGMTNLVMTRAMVIGVAPGYDVAVVALPRTGQFYGWADFYRNIFRGSLVDPLPAGPLRFAVAGYPGAHWQGILEWTGQPWEEEMQMFSHWRPRPGANISPLKSSDLSLKAVPIETLKECPQAFLDFCYRVQVRTHGFSGGALMIGPNRQMNYSVEQPKLAGLISHFSPLASDTYVIPISTALRVANRLLATAKKGGMKTIAYETVDESGSAEWLGDHSVRILKGPHQGQVFSTVSLTSGKAIAGGGPSTGGGGPSTGGGGPSTGGGGDTARHISAAPSGTKFILPSTWHSLGLVHRQRFLEDLNHSENWGLVQNDFIRLITIHPQYVGVGELLSFAPGLRSSTGTYLYGNGKPLLHIQQVVAAARQGSEMKLTPGAKIDFPSTLSLRGPQIPGLVHLASLHLAKPFSQLSAVERENTYVDLPRIAQAAEQTFGAQGRAAALLTSGDYIGNLAAGNLIRDAGRARLEMLSGRYGKMVLDFPDRFSSAGESFFQYRGEMQITEMPIFEKTKLPLRAQGVVTVQKDFEHNRYEVKVLLAAPDIPIRANGPGTLWEQMLQPTTTFESTWTFVVGFFLPFDGTTPVALIDNRTMVERELEQWKHLEAAKLQQASDPSYQIGSRRRGPGLPRE